MKKISIVTPCYNEDQNVELLINSVRNVMLKNPEYEYEFFEDADCRKFIEDNFDKSILEAYDTLIPNAFKADLFRYCYLYKNGGVYTDCKMILRLPFREWIPKNEDYILVEDAGNKQFYNAVMGLKAKNNAIYSAILKIKDNISSQKGDTTRHSGYKEC